MRSEDQRRRLSSDSYGHLGDQEGGVMDWYLPGVPPVEGERIAQAMQRPEGTIVFWGVYPQLLDTKAKAGTLLRVVVGELIFLLERDASMTLRFVQSSPSVGTREAIIALHPLVKPDEPCERFFFALVWSPTETRVNIGRDGGSNLLEGVGQLAGFTLQVAKNGDVVRIGDPGMAVMGARIYSGGKQSMGPSAMKLWEDTRAAAETLLTGQSESGYLFETVVANAVLSALVTGFEGYCQQRFLELESEGIPADFANLVSKFLSREERDQFARGEELELQRKALVDGVSSQRLLADRINFQDFNSANRAFNRGYGIKFGELSAISSQDLEHLRRLILYRHRVIHVSPLLGMLNGAEVPPEDPYFSNKATAELAIKSFHTFITALHKRTLELRPHD